MADYVAQGARNSVGTALTRRTGTASADRVATGSTVVFHNTGVGAHIATFTNNGTYGGLAVGNRTLSIPAGGGAFITVDAFWDSDGDGYVAIAIDGTAAEVSFYVLSV
jgi:hypothetical protein